MCDPDGQYDSLDIVSEPANNAYTYGSKLILGAHLRYNYRSRNARPSFLILDDIIRSVYLHFIFKPFRPFYESFNKKLELLSESGIMSYVVGSACEPKWTPPDSGPMVLTFMTCDLDF